MYNQNNKLMKTIFKTITVLLIFLLTYSCGSDDSSSTSPSANDNFIRANVDGIAYEVTGSALHANIDEGYGLDIDSRNSSGTGMDFYIIGDGSVGTYNFSTANVTTQGRLNYRLSGENFTTGFCSVSNGTLTITSKTGNTIEGTFSFMGSSMSESCATPSTKTVTNGTFKVVIP